TCWDLVSMSGALPQGACDCHCHIFGPAARFPYAERAVTRRTMPRSKPISRCLTAAASTAAFLTHMIDDPWHCLAASACGRNGARRGSSSKGLSRLENIDGQQAILVDNPARLSASALH